MDTIVELSPAYWNFVFTHAVVGDGKAMDWEIAREVKSVAAARGGGDLWSVRLTVNADEPALRVVSPERRARMKEIDPVATRNNAAQPPFDLDLGQSLLIDTSGMKADETVATILSRLNCD